MEDEESDESEEEVEEEEEDSKEEEQTGKLFNAVDKTMLKDNEEKFIDEANKKRHFIALSNEERAAKRAALTNTTTAELLQVLHEKSVKLSSIEDAMNMYCEENGVTLKVLVDCAFESTENPVPEGLIESIENIGGKWLTI